MKTATKKVKIDKFYVVWNINVANPDDKNIDVTVYRGKVKHEYMIGRRNIFMNVLSDMLNTKSKFSVSADMYIFPTFSIIVKKAGE